VVRLLHSNRADARQPIANDKPRRFSAVTATPSEIIRIDKELLDTLLTWSQISAPEEEVVMCEQGVITVNKGQWLNTMIKSPTFRNLPPANIEALLNRLEPIMVLAGDVIIRQGDAGDYFYMIDSGVAMVTRNPDNDEDSIEMAELNPGDTFGEAALISNNPRNATVSMMSDGVLLRLSKQDCINLLKQPNLQWYDFSKAQEKVSGGTARWIDVRLPTEFQRSHLPDTINIPMRDLHKQAHALDHSVSYICYCETGRRSSAAAFVLKQYGLQTSVLQDGLKNIGPDEMVQ
jgi:CRP-like cAMP-binding protein/rhodanese-related sulfurtransferase